MRDYYREQNVRRTLCFERVGRASYKKDSKDGKRSSEYIQSTRMKRGKFEKQNADCQEPSKVDKVRCNLLQAACKIRAICMSESTLLN